MLSALIFSLAAAASEPPAPIPAVLEPTGILSLQAAAEAALAGNPRLAPYTWDVRIADAGIVQAGLRPNPEVSLEAEGVTVDGGTDITTSSFSSGLGFDGSAIIESGRERERNDLSAFEQAEFTLRLSQLFELGGKRGARIDAAERTRDVAVWDYEVARYAVLGEVVRAFTEVLAAQERVVQAEQLAALADRLAQAVRGQVEAGRVSPLEGRRALAEAERVHVDLVEAQRALDQARLALAATWGSTTPAFDRAVGDLATMAALLPLEDVLDALETTPELERWAAELARREAVVVQERKQRMPDVSVSLGYTAEAVPDAVSSGFSAGTGGLAFSRASNRADSDWEHSLEFEVSIPLPLFDRNQGNIRAAELMVSKAADERRADQVAIKTALAALYADAEAAHEKVTSLEERVLPELETSYDLTQEGYERGKFDLITVLDAERALAQVRNDALEARVTFHNALAGMEALLGAPVLQDVAEDVETSVDAAASTSDTGEE